MRKFQLTLMAACVMLAGFFANPASAREQMLLKDNWRLQSSAKFQAQGEDISSPGFADQAWYPTSVPKTVLAALVENNVYPDPYYGLNMKSIPGYVDGRWLVMPKDSPFYPSWWYRTEFTLPKSYAGKVLTLHLDGINYKANVWLNGKKIGASDQIKGMFQRFELDVTGQARPGKVNCLAIETIAPGKLPLKNYPTKQVEATTGWDDHNPQPPDMNLGVWEDVSITATGPVRIKHPYVASDLDVPSLSRAGLTVMAYVMNQTGKQVKGELCGRIENIKFKKQVELSPYETRLVKFTPAEFAGLNIKNPRVWWPHPVGPQELYELGLEFKIGNQVSDFAKTGFGIREATSYINEEGWRQYMINGQKILIRGGAWMTSDMMLNLSDKRYDALVRYAREANLNMLRSEGFSIRETEEFYNLCDKYGVMVTQQIFGRNLPDEALAIACIDDMMLRIRNHPSLVHFLGHDETYPTETLDQAYQDLIDKYELRRTYQPHSGAFNPKNRWNTGGTRTGTLELWTHAGPAHYYLYKKDGAWGFAQSGGIGGIFACIESVKRMIPEDQLWPLWTEAWSFHTVIQGGHYYDDLLKAMNKRYGKPADVEDLVMTGQVMNYEAARGMYEAYGRNKYSATGITTWKYDAAWPAALTWQYVDWYLLPTGAYYGAKKACEALHVQYSYDDHSVYVVNSMYEQVKDLTVIARVYNFDLAEKYAKTAKVDVGPDGKTEAFVIDWPKGLTRSHFLRLELNDAGGSMITDNFYWLSTRPERPPRKLYGLLTVLPGTLFDHTGLRELAPVKVSASCSVSKRGLENVARVKIENPSDDLAFFIQLAVTKGEGGYEVAPGFWSENNISLLPGEAKELEAVFYERDLEGREPVVRVGGWNIVPAVCKP